MSPRHGAGQEARSQARHRQVERWSTIYAPLVKDRLLSQGELDAAAAECAEKELPLEPVLMRRHAVPKKAVGSALAAFYRCPFVEFDGRLKVGLSPFRVSLQYLRRNLWAPILAEGSTLHVVLDDPRSAAKLQDIQDLFPGSALKLYVALREDILLFVEELGKAEPGAARPASIDAILGDDAAAAPEAEPAREEPEVREDDGVVVRLVNQIVRDAVRAGASDIHVEPYADKDTIVRFRVDGDCRIYQRIPARYRRALAARIKIMAGLDIAERRKPQDGKISFREQDHVVELRVATVPTVAENEDVVLRILASGEPVPLTGLGLTPGNARELRRLLETPYGLILCAGPTGSGKTTTLHSALGYLNGPDMKIWTAEDPVEITQYGLRQVSVQPRIGVTFAAVLRSFLRADPDVIMVGEMRDGETAELAVRASLTGHLVLSTLHTNSAPETVVRLLDMGLDPFHCADALLGVLAQRLARRLCRGCRRPVRATADDVAAAARVCGGAGAEELRALESGALPLHRADGCAECGGTGYKGRVALHELMTFDDALRKLVRARAPSDKLLAAALGAGMRTLAQDGLFKALAGDTDLREVAAAVKQP